MKRQVAGRGVVFVLAAFLSATSALHCKAAGMTLDRHAADYLALVADLGTLDPESVDAVPAGTATKHRRPTMSFATLSKRSQALASQVRATSDSGEDRPRARSLASQLDALAFRSAQRTGARAPLADELRRLFALELSTVSVSTDDGGAARRALARRLPGPGPFSRRLSQYQRRFAVPRARLHAVITRSIAACRGQTQHFFALPAGESLELEYVVDEPWSGYSVYHGNYRSVMQVNRGLTISIGQALNLACHEGYPGHHTYNSLREQHLVRGQGRLEAVSGLIFSPDGFRAEALAAAAAEMAFSTAEQIRLYREHLFPLAGLDPDEAETYVEVDNLIDQLTAATTLAIRRYLADEIDASDAAAVLERSALMEHPEGLVDYVDRYRGYTLAYTWGRDRLLSRLNRPELSVEDRWRLLHQLMTSPNDQNDLFP